MKHALLVLVLAACNEKPTGTPVTTTGSGSAASSPTASSPAAGDPCSAVGEAVRSIWDKQVADATDPETKKGAEQMRDKAVGRLERHCRDDHWSPDVISCVRSGGSTCTNRMTAEQAQKLTADRLE